MPFITPLLCVTARNGSSNAKRHVSTIRRPTSAPLKPLYASSEAGTRKLALARRSGHMLERIRTPGRALSEGAAVAAMAKTESETPSTTVLMRFAPIEDCTSS